MNVIFTIKQFQQTYFTNMHKIMVLESIKINKFIKMQVLKKNMKFILK